MISVNFTQFIILNLSLNILNLLKLLRTYNLKMKKKTDDKTDFEILILKELGKRIATKRRKLGSSQEKFSGFANVSKGGLSMIEDGLSNPTLVRLLRISRNLNISVAELLKDIEKANEEIKKALKEEYVENRKATSSKK